MPPASHHNHQQYHDIEAGDATHNGSGSQHVRFHQPPPSIIHHPDASSLPPALSSPPSGHQQQGRKSLKKKIKKVFGGGRHNNHKHHQHQHQQDKGRSNQQEQDSLLPYYPYNGSNNMKPYSHNNGTFDTATYTTTTTYSMEDTSTQSKWSTLREQLKRNAPDMWAETQELAEQRKSQATNDKRQLVKQAQDSIRSLMNISIWQCLLAIVLYVGFSVGCFSFWLEHWTIVDSTYFAVVSFTTIGYGDEVPTTPLSRMFTCFWALSGVACLGIALGVVGSNLIEVSEQEQKKVQQRHGTEVISMFLPPRYQRDSGWQQQQHPQGETWSDLGSHGVEDYLQPRYLQCHHDGEEEGRCCCSIPPKVLRCFLVVVFLALVLYGMSETEQWTLWSTIYYGLITASTVGYGDLAPKTEMGRILAIVYIPMAVVLMGTVLDIVANAIIARHHKRAQHYLKSKELTLRDLEVMDNDGDGTVSRAEFLEFMLVSMNQVDQETLDNLNEHFDRLDKDGSGSLDKADLIIRARTKLDSERQLCMV